MSGIAVTYNKLYPVNRSWIDKMSHLLSYRGGDKKFIYNGERISMLKCKKNVTEEDILETSIFYNYKSGLSICADSRIDNRDYLRKTLCVTNPVSDQELILRSYLKWGSDCVNYLLGDFAFVVYDKERDSLICARDHMGVRPLFMGLFGDSIVLSSDIRSIFHVFQDEVILDTESLSSNNLLDLDRLKITGFKNIRSVEAGSVIEVCGHQIKEWRYWTPHPISTERRADQEWIDGLRTVMSEAVRCRMRSTSIPCIELSGGIDSNAVAHLAASTDHKFVSISILAQGIDETDESSLIQESIEALKCDKISIHIEDLSYFEHLNKSIQFTGRVHSTASLCLLPSIYKKASSFGHKVILDGYDGDTTIGFGFERLAILSARADWGQIFNEIKSIKNVSSDMSDTRIWDRYVLPVLNEGMGYYGVLEMTRLVKYLSIYTELSLLQSINYVLRRLRNFVQGVESLSSGAYEGLSLPIRDFRAGCDNWVAYNLDGINNPILLWGLEWKNAMAAAYGLEARHPFMDKRVVEYSLAMPTHLKLREGYNRWALRKSLPDSLPNSIRWRANKANFRPVLQELISTGEGSRFADEVKNLSSLPGKFSSSVVSSAREAYTRILSGHVEPKDYALLWSAIYASHWSRFFHINE